MHRIPRWVILTCLLLAAPAKAAEPTLPWSSDLNKSLEAARKSGKRVFIDFTGDS